MATVVVGGHSRKVGKTSIAAGIIAAFPQCHWTAVKITSHQHAEAPSSAITEETDCSGRSDTSRFLVAGAGRALWVRAREGVIATAVHQLLSAIQSDPFVIIESNRILQFIRPDLYVLVLRYDVEDFKDSARETLCRADAIVAVNYRSSSTVWKGLEIPASIPLFKTTDPQRIPEGLIDFLDSRLQIPDSREKPAQSGI
jgi:hypothetical protein